MKEERQRIIYMRRQIETNDIHIVFFLNDAQYENPEKSTQRNVGKKHNTKLQQIQMTNDKLKNHSTNISFSIGKTLFLQFSPSLFSMLCFCFGLLRKYSTYIQYRHGWWPLWTWCGSGNAQQQQWRRRRRCGLDSITFLPLSFLVSDNKWTFSRSQTILLVSCSEKEDTFSCCCCYSSVFVVIYLLVWVSSFQNIIQALSFRLWGWLFWMNRVRVCVRALGGMFILKSIRWIKS